MEASRVGVDAFGTFLKALREYEREGEERLLEELAPIGVPDRTEAVRRILGTLRDADASVAPQQLLLESGLTSEDFSKVMQTLVGVGIVTVTVQADGVAVDLTEQGRAAFAAE